MATFTLSTKGFTELQRAIKRNPQKVRDETGKFLVRAMAAYNQGILRSPWRMGNRTGGGAPVATGNLRDTHQREIRPFEARIYPTAPYAAYVHGVGGKKVNSRGVMLRPWLNYVFKTKDSEVQRHADAFLQAVTRDLAV